MLLASSVNFYYKNLELGLNLWIWFLGQIDDIQFLC